MSSRKILVVDDDPSVLSCYGRLFRREGYDPCLEANGSGVEKRLMEYRDVEVLVLDYRLQGMTGFDLLRRLHTLDFRPGVVLVSGHTGPEMIEEARRLGIRRIFAKPVDKKHLLRAVEESFQARDQQGVS